MAQTVSQEPRLAKVGIYWWRFMTTSIPYFPYHYVLYIHAKLNNNGKNKNGTHYYFIIVMTHTCTYMSTRSRTHTLAHTRRCPRTRINTQHTDGHTVARIHRQMSTHTHMHRHTHTDRCPHTRICTDTHTQTDVHTDRCPHTHIHTGRCPSVSNSDFGIERVKFGLYWLSHAKY